MATIHERALAWKKKKEEEQQKAVQSEIRSRAVAWKIQKEGIDLEQVGQQITDRVNTWLNSSNTYLDNYNTRFGGRKGDYTDAYVADSREYLTSASQQARSFAVEANDIKNILNQYGSFFNQDWVSGITKVLDEETAKHGQIRQAAAQDVSYWSQFKDEDAYKKAQTYDEQSKADLSMLSTDLEALRGQLQEARNVYGQIATFNPSAYADSTAAIAEEQALKTKLAELTKPWGGMEGMEAAFSEKEQYYNSAKGIQLEMEQRKADLPKLSGELEELRKAFEAARGIAMRIDGLNRTAYGKAEKKNLEEQLANLTEKWGGMEGLKAALSEKEQYYNTAKRYQDWEKLGDAVNNADFAEMSGYKSTEIDEGEWLKRMLSQYSLGYGDPVHEFINGDQETRKKIWQAYSAKEGLGADIDRFDVYNRMSEKEIATYNYHYNKNGKEAAEEYLRSITETVGHRAAEARFEKLEGKPLAEILYGMKSGADQFKSGMKGAWNAITGKDSYTPANTTQILGGMVREDLKDNALGKMAYDILSTTTNMVPSIAVSAGVGLVSKTAGAAVGAGLMGAGAAGNAYTEMINEGHSKTQAGNYAKLVGLSEAGLSYLLGGIGKLGGKVSGKMIGKIVDKVDDVFSKVAIKLGGTAISEGMEEGLQEILTPWFKQVATGIQEDINWEEAAYSSLLGAITGVLFEGKSAVAEAKAEVNGVKNTEAKTGKPAQLTQGEKLVAEKITADRVAEAQKDGKKLSKAEKAEIYNRVVEDMYKGYLTTGEIEAAMLGNTEYDRLIKEKEEFDRLYKTESGKLTEEQKDRLAELKDKNQQTSYEEAVEAARAKHSHEVEELVKTSRLGESYREQGRRNEAFQADLSKYSEKQKKIVQSAMDSGILNNTNRTHEFVDFIAKVSERLGVDFSFTDNKRLKESGFAVDGVTVNGFVNEKGVTVNVNSAKALNSVVGHEITHVLEGTGLYDSLKTAVETWGNTKGVYKNKLRELTKLYEGKEGYTGADAKAKIEREVVADLVGDYLFTDKAFVENLSKENPGLFQKIFDEIKHLYKLVTAGSKEARQLEKVKKVFQNVYREGVKNPTAEGGIKYSLNENAQTELHKAIYDKSYQGEVLLRDESPPIMLAQKGVKNLPMSMNASHIRENVFTEEEAQKMGLRVDKGINYHGLGEEFFLQIIDGLDNVKEAYRGTKNADNAARRENYFLLVSEFADKDGNVINVPVYINEHALFNRVFIDVNKVSTVYGKTNFRDYINRQIRLNNLVRIKNRSIQTSESNAPIARDYGKDTSINSIRNPRGNVNNQNSLSAQGQVESGGKGWQVRGRDVALEDGPGFPLPPGYQEGASVAGSTQKTVTPAQENREISFPMLEDAARVEEQEDGLFPLPEDIALQEQRQMDAEFRERMGEDPVLYDTDGDEGVETTRDKLEVKQKNLQWQLQENRRLKESTMQIFDKQIEELQAKYDGKKHKESKNSQALLRRIQRLKRQKSDRAAEYDQTIGQIQNRIGKLEEKLQTGTPEKTDKLEKIFKRIDDQLEHDELELSRKYYEDKYRLKEETKSREAWIREQASTLYWEDATRAKGSRPSNLLGVLWDQRLPWQELRYALQDIANHPEAPVRLPGTAENAVREVLGRAYEDRVQELEYLDEQYQNDLDKLRKDAQEQKDKAKLAESRRGKQQAYTAEVAELVGDTTTWKDKKVGLSYQTNTLHRNLRDVVRDAEGNRDIQKADAIYDYLQGSYNRNEAELNREAARIKNPYAEMKITKAEDAYIQMLGELRHNPDTELLPDQVEEFYQANKDSIDKDKVDKIIDMARETYDALLPRINEVLRAQGMKEIPYRKGYFPHFTEDKQGWFAKILNWKVNKNQLPTDIAGLTETYQPQRSWQRFNKQRMSDTTDYSFMKGMDTYVQGALDWIYHIEDIQKRRAFENYLRYVHSDKGVQARIDKIFDSNDYDATEAQEQIDLILKEKENPLNNFVTDLRTGTNLLAGKKHSKDRNMEMDLNREVYSTMTNISNRVSANMVAGSISSATTNFIPITQSWSQVSPISSLKAMKQTVQALLSDDGIIDKSDFLTNRLRQAEKLYQTGWDKASKVTGKLMEVVDNFTSQTVWRSKYMENKAAGMTEVEAIRNADLFAEGLMAGRSRGNMPTIFESKNLLTRMATAFQLEVANQYGYMFKDMPQDMKDAGIGKMLKGYATMFLGAYAYNALFSKLTGRNSAFDPNRILQELL